MPNKHSYESVKASLEANGHTLLSDYYKNNRQSLELKCNNGHEFTLTYSAFLRFGSGCRYCKDRYYYDEVKEIFESKNYKLITSRVDYKNTYNRKVIFECPNGHIGKMKVGRFIEGRRCRLCFNDRRKLNFDYIKEAFEKEGYILLSQEYKNNRTKLECECPKGHIVNITAGSFINDGRRCAACVGVKRYTIEEVQNIFELEGYKLISTEYKGANAPITCICPNGHEWVVKFSSFNTSNHRCYFCYDRKQLSFDEVKKAFEDEGYILLETEYINSKTKMNYICPRGHKRSTIWNIWRSGCRCPVCNYIDHSGPNASNWKGGISCEPYCQDWVPEYKNYIKSRDGYKCLNPHCYNNSKDLTVHHINYDKKQCNPENLITLCRSCNAKANYDREWHIAWYQAILNKRYGYIYL
jgi:hypothetical protein